MLPQHSSDHYITVIHLFRVGYGQSTHAEVITVGSKTELHGEFIENLFGCVICLHIMFLLGKDDVEDGVRPAACLIHVGCSHGPTKKKNKET